MVRQCMIDDRYCQSNNSKRTFEHFSVDDAKQLPTTTTTKAMRSIWKGPFFVPFAPSRLAKAAAEPIRTDARSCTILPSFVGKKFLIHNGKSYVPVTVSEDMVGHKLGEFAATKKPAIFKVLEWTPAFLIGHFSFCGHLLLGYQKVKLIIALSNRWCHTRDRDRWV